MLPGALASRPELPDHLVFVWQAFRQLSGDRPLGFGTFGPISFASISAYADRYSITDIDEFDRFLRLIRSMDSEWMTATAKRMSEKG